jgi:hypothetical protein
MDWIDLAQARDRWRALVNRVIRPLVSIKCEEIPDYLRRFLLLRKYSDP